MHLEKSTKLVFVSTVLFVAWLSSPGVPAFAQAPRQEQQTSDATTVDQASDGGDSEVQPLTSDQAKELVAKAIESFHRGIIAEDRPTQLKAVQHLFPEEKHIACLFGKEHAKLGFEVIKPRLDEMTARLDDVSRQLSRDGRFLRCDLEAVEIPSKLERRALTALMQGICPETFRFKAEIHSERSRSSSSSYFVINRKVVYIRDGELIQIARRINTTR